ncbi:hypothetical protein Q4603_17600 [Zobellia galactanivorans]|uniref:Uncharacterized protein n=1 Tax=Zobellia galactanivorans (strain DSM 12802 / CCUG 47099 / CIP 106680 / NCIMB 13871 / Dsij) TaxID=63186 RepID=G0L2R4_ZOBGA|nr:MULTISPECIES: hypothetical protein [Zobellia]MDO6810442.1 hypothetical protein [Zobellia galactanivorans]OWW26202.1 hypothetical protein B4Q04_00520 [Zobellia sp. OII3]CAZ95143.1 Conserved hypothetical protein [Zobellia galactanivorans]
MKRTLYIMLMIIMTTSFTTLTSCREEHKDTGDKIEDAIDDTGDAIEEGAEDVEDGIEDAVDDN